jgi:GLPGLI family protein
MKNAYFKKTICYLFTFATGFFLTVIHSTAQDSQMLTVTYRATLNLSKKSIIDSFADQNYTAYLIINPGASLFFLNSTFGVSEKINQNTGLETPVISFDSMQKSFKNFEKNELICEENIFKNVYYYRDSLHNQNWAIAEETKQVGDLNCVKATCHFRGRHYTAWFAPDIPISNGPWKFGGLPGLILDLYDDEHKLRYIFQSLKYTTTPAKTKIPVSKVIEYSLFVVKFKAVTAKIAAYMKANATENAGEAKITTDINFETIEKH